jgi:Protein of unknown function (DUF3102)
VATYNHDGQGVNHLDDLAARIRAEHDDVQAAAGTGIAHALNAGDLLIEAKRRLKHGEWLAWLSEHCNILERWAWAYMRLARYLRALSDGTRT